MAYYECHRKRRKERIEKHEDGHITFPKIACSGVYKVGLEIVSRKKGFLSLLFRNQAERTARIRCVDPAQKMVKPPGKN